MLSMDPISLPVIHPAFEKLKRSCSVWHKTAGLLILTHALSHIHEHICARNDCFGLYSDRNWVPR